MRQGPAITLPASQRFDCQCCSHCCRQVVVNVTEQERRRILAAGWQERLPGVPLFVAYRFRRRRLHRLAQGPDGGCVFLDAKGLCRLHAESGSELKPLPCRLYPFVPTPGSDGVHLDLRGDCPAVAANTGRPIAVHLGQVRALTVETGTQSMGVIPGWPGRRPLEPNEFNAVVAAMLACLRKSGQTNRARLRAGCRLLEFLYEINPQNVRGARLSELICAVLFQAAWEEDSAEQPNLPPRAGRLFRQWLFLHGVCDEPARLDDARPTRLRRSWQRYGQSRRFARGTGPIPRVHADWPMVTFEKLAALGPASDESLEPLCRSIAVKLEAHAFAGPGYFGYDLISGLTALWLLPALTGWFARLAAVMAGRDALIGEDVLTGLRRAHRSFGVSPVFGRMSERLRLRALSREGIPAALLAAYGP